MNNAAHPAAPNPASPYAIGLAVLMPLLAVPLLFAMSASGGDPTPMSDFLSELFIRAWWLFLASWPVSIALAVTVLARRTATPPMRVQACIGLALAASWVPVALWILSLFGQ
jgi:hypothetical protein